MVHSPSKPRRMEGDDVAIKLDDQGEPHIVYNLDRLLRHAWRVNGSFQTELINEFGWRRRKSWVLGSNELRVVYNNPSHATTLFQSVRSKTSAWTYEFFQVPDRSAGVSGIWKDGALVLAYLQQVPETAADPSSRMPLRQTLVFADEHVPAAGTGLTYIYNPVFTALAAGANDTVHFLYTAPPENLGEYGGCGDCYDPQTVRFVTHSPAGWSEPEMLTTPGYYSGLTLATDSGGNLHAAFSVASFFTSPEAEAIRAMRIDYLTRPARGGAWERESLPVEAEVQAWQGSLVLDSEDGVHLVYRNEGAWYAHRSDGVWSTEPIETGCARLGTYAALTLAPDGTLHAAYEGCDGELRHASRPPGKR